MRRYRLFCPALSPGRVILSREESRHLMVSLRAKPGQEVALFDGAGGEALGTIVGTARRGVEVSVVEVTQRPFELVRRITLAVAMGRAHRQGYLIEKCTELGVAGIWPIIADHSVSRPDSAAVARWSRRAIEAAKQSGRAWVPQVAAAQTFAGALARVGQFDAVGLPQSGPSLPPFGDFLALLPEGASVCVWVGPEGGWSEDERDRALAAGAVPSSLGPTVLRTETAAVAVCAAAAMLSAASRGQGESQPRKPQGATES